MVSTDASALASDITLFEVDETPVQLASLWEKRPAVLVFLRHFG